MTNLTDEILREFDEFAKENMMDTIEFPLYRRFFSSSLSRIEAAVRKDEFAKGWRRAEIAATEARSQAIDEAIGAINDYISRREKAYGEKLHFSVFGEDEEANRLTCYIVGLRDARKEIKRLQSLKSPTGEKKEL